MQMNFSAVLISFTQALAFGEEISKKDQTIKKNYKLIDAVNTKDDKPTDTDTNNTKYDKPTDTDTNNTKDDKPTDTVFDHSALLDSEQVSPRVVRECGRVVGDRPGEGAGVSVSRRRRRSSRNITHDNHK